MAETKRILIPYFLAGSGHRSIAEAVSAEISAARPGWDVRLLEPSEELHDQMLNELFRKNWRRILRLPDVPQQIVFSLNSILPFVSSTIIRAQLVQSVQKAMGFLAGYRPDLILSTHWGTTLLFALAREKLLRTTEDEELLRVRRRERPIPARLRSKSQRRVIVSRAGTSELQERLPLQYVFTELGGSYRLVNCGADQYYVMSWNALQDLQEIGIEAGTIRKVGMIVRRSLRGVLAGDNGFKAAALPSDDNRETSRPGPDSPLSSGGTPTVLFSVGGEGIGPAADFVDTFLRHSTSGQLIVLAGRNERLRRELESRGYPDRVRIYGFRDDMERMMSEADIIAGKCGTSLTMEAAVLRKPFIITAVGAPSERPNMEFVVRHGLGWKATSPEAFAELIDRLERDPQELQRVRDNLVRFTSGDGDRQDRTVRAAQINAGYDPDWSKHGPGGGAEDVTAAIIAELER